MSAWLTKIKTYWQTHPRFQRGVFVGGGALVLAVMILIATGWGDWLIRAIKAEIPTDTNRYWQLVDQTGGPKAAHAKLITINQGGKRYLYVVGGVTIKDNAQQNRNQTVILDTVRRLEINSINGKVVGTTWEGGDQSWGKMNFGRMEFSLLEHNGYLYAIGGDINVPPVNPDQNVQVPMLYSTIERLNLANPTSGWQMYAILSGVNFYTEAKVINNEINVVGGVYGNPFPPLDESVKDTYLDDMIDAPGDAIKWTGLGINNLNVIGSVNPYLTKAGPGGAISTTTGPLLPAVLTPVSQRPQPGTNGYQYSTTTTVAELEQNQSSQSQSSSSGSGSGATPPSSTDTTTSQSGVTIQATGENPVIFSLTFPRGGNVLITDAPVTINWTGNGISSHGSGQPATKVNLYWRLANGEIWKKINSTPIAFADHTYTWWELTPGLAGFPPAPDKNRITILAVMDVDGQLPSYNDGIEKRWYQDALSGREMHTRRFELVTPDDEANASFRMGTVKTVNWKEWRGDLTDKNSTTQNKFILSWRPDPTASWEEIGRVLGEPGIAEHNYTFDWTIPRQPTADYTAQIRICSPLANVDNCAINTKPFKISNGGFAVTKPVYGDKWQVGSIHEIAWNKGDLDGQFQVVLKRRPDSTNEDLGAPTDGSTLNWTVTGPPMEWDDPAETGARIGVYSLKYKIYVWAPYPLTITPVSPPTQTVTVLSPNGGEKWEIGSTYPISWKSENYTGTLDIRLCRPSGNVNQPTECFLTIVGNQSANGSYAWAIPDNGSIAPRTDYSIRIGVHGNLTTWPWDYSDARFSIGEQLNPSFINLNPVPGTTLYWGTKYDIGWVMQDFDAPQKVNLAYSNNDGASWTTFQTNFTSSPGQNRFSNLTDWTIPQNSTKGRLRVCLVSSTACQNNQTPPASEGIVGTYTLEKYTPPPQLDTIHIVQPAGGEDLTPGTTFQIVWSASFPNHPTGRTLYDIDYFVDGQWYIVASAVPGANRTNQFDTRVTYNWNVPAISVDASKIRVTARKFSASDTVLVQDISEEFSIAGGSDELASKLSNALIDGTFVTTVGEHYVIQDVNGKGKQRAFSATERARDIFGKQIDELGSDYIGNLSDFWKVGVTMRIGHLRFLVTVVDKSKTTTPADTWWGHPITVETITLDAVPVPQGRYGHKLVTNFSGYNLVVLGGASWAKELNIKNTSWGNVQNENFKTFWVVDDGIHPVAQDALYKLWSNGSKFEFDYGKTNYKYVGNIVYGYTGNTWRGTNGTKPDGTNASVRLPDNYAFKDQGDKRGRAFFGLAEIDSQQWLAVGGLNNITVTGGQSNSTRNYEAIVNQGTYPYTAYFRVPVSPTGRAEVFAVNKWNQDVNYDLRLDDTYLPSYNLETFSVNNKRAVVYTGQTEFQLPFKVNEGLTLDAHVPDYDFGFSRKTLLYQATSDEFAERWFAMSDMLMSGNQNAEIDTLVINPSNMFLRAGQSASFGLFAYDSNGSRLSQDGMVCTWATDNGNVGSIDVTNGRFYANAFATPGSTQQVSVTCRTKKGIISKTATAWAKIQADGDIQDQQVQFVMFDPPTAKLRQGASRMVEVIIRNGLGGQLPPGTDITVSVSSNTNFTVTKVGDNSDSHLYKVTAKATAQLGENNQALTGRVTQGGRTMTTHMAIEITDTATLEDASATFAANTAVVTGSGTDPVIAAYNFGGLTGDEFSDMLQMLGLFGKGALYATVTVTGSPIAPDNYSSATVTVTLRNGVDEPVYQDDNGDRYASTLYTSRPTGSNSSIVTDSRAFNPDKVDRAERLGEKVEDQLNNQYAYFDTNGQATFNIYSKELTNPDIDVTAIISRLGGSPFSLVSTPAKLVVANIDGVPSILNSSIQAVPTTVAADGTAVSNVTVTLKDWRGQPVSGYWARLLSDRNTDVTIDTISADQQVNATTGEAKFTIKSSTRGLATLRFSYAKTATDVDDWPELPDLTANVKFVGVVTLEPNSEKQGQTMPTLTARGIQTSWATGKTTIKWIAPSTLSFADRANNGRVLPANGFTRSRYTVVSGQPNTTIELAITEGTGSFWSGQGNTNTLTVTTDAAGEASFFYQHGDTTGLVKIEARTVDNTKRELWLYLVTSRTINPYTIKVVADPWQLATGDTTTVKAGLYRYTSSGQELIEDADITLTVEDGTMGATSKVNGLTQATYTKGTQLGDTYIFATATLGNLVLANTKIISARVNLGGIQYSPSDLTIEDEHTIVINNVVVARDAIIGYWTFVTETDLDGDGVVDETESTLFHVLPENYTADGPVLTSVSPGNSNRPASNLKVTITGLGTNFWPGDSTVTFTHATNQNATGITVKNVTVLGDDLIEATIDVSATATLGDWNVKVDTNLGGQGHEIAELPGTADFVVGVAHNMGIDILATPSIIPRNGWAQSQLTTFVYRYDPLTHIKTGISGVTVNYTLEGGTGGTLYRVTGTTGADGYVIGANHYTTDNNPVGAEIFVVGSATINNLPVRGEVMIIRYGTANNGNLMLSANLTSLPLTSTPNTSALTAVAKDNGGQPVGSVRVDYLLVGDNGAVVPSFSTTNGQGQATSTFRRNDGLTQPTIATIIAKADIPNVGLVFSAPVEIAIGDFSQFNLTFTCGGTNATNCIVPTSGGRSTLLATLLRSGSAQSRWPISFSISAGAIDDYLTKLGGETNTSGQLATDFVAGLYSGSLFVTAKPIGLPAKQVIITKQADSTVSSTLSTITAVPRFVMANGADVATITVTVRNAKNSPLAGKTVTIVSDQTGDSIAPANKTRITGFDGKAIFTISATATHESAIRATVDGITLGPAYVTFVPVGSLITANFDVTIPFQNKAYDRSVLVYLRELTGNTAPTINLEVYATDANNKLIGLPTIYLSPNKQYAMWVKGPYHLARVRNFTSPSTNGTVTLSFADGSTNTNPNGGLFIGDLALPQNPQGGIPIYFHDNYVDVLDYPVISRAYGTSDYIADIWPDGWVEVQDYVQFVVNYLNPGHGPALP